MPWLTLAKYVLPPILLVVIGFAIFYKGKSVERTTHVHQQMKLKIERLLDDAKVVTEGDKIKRKVEKIKKTPVNPAKDEVYSCLLSNDPFSGVCDPLLQPSPSP